VLGHLYLIAFHSESTNFGLSQCLKNLIKKRQIQSDFVLSHGLIPGLITLAGLSPKNRDIFLGSDFFNRELRPKLQGLSAVLRA
jgi:hypothetical protein